MSKLILLSLTVPATSFVYILFSAAEEGLPSVTTLIVPVIVIGLLILANGLYVASEFAIIGVRSSQLEQMENEGNSKAGNVLEIIDSRPKQDQYIATAQLGVTMASLGLAMYGEPRISHFIEPYMETWFGLSDAATRTIGYLVALSLLTYLHVVIGEMVPKALALMDASGMALRVYRPMQISEKILSVPVRILNSIGNKLLKILHVPPAQGQASLLAPEEIELLVTESTEGGLFLEEEEEIIRNIFDFSERTVGQVMTPRTKVQAVPIDMPKDDLIKLVTESRHSRFPIYEGDLDHVVGILHLKDLIRQTIKPEAKLDLRLILRPAPLVPEDQHIETLLGAMKRAKLHMGVVLDEFGGMAGVVTLEDLIEEVVGEVRDEFDLEREPYVEIGPGVFEVSGDYLVDDLTEKIYLGDESELPDVETVGGLVVAGLGRPPRVNDEVIYNDSVHFIVLDVDRRAVSRVRIEYPVPNEFNQDNKEENGSRDGS
ncbi:MAG: hemolysin family protein [Candidatus Promineifilaceae bacterium]